MSTQKQIAANRRNAQKSTGPITATGKSVSRWNALKHSLLARQVIAEGYLHQESRAEFKALCREYHQSLAPVGPLEEMLLEQITTAVWRLRRVRAAESGNIAASVDRKWWNPRLTPWEIGNGHKGNALDHSLEQYCNTVEGIEFVIECIQDLRAAVEKTGELTYVQLKELGGCYPLKPNQIVAQLAELHEALEKNPERLPPAELRARHLKDVFACLDHHAAEYETLIDEVQENMDAEDVIRRAAAALPSEEVIDKIVRYESALFRQLYRSMNQLERLQRRRLGETVPPPITLDVSSRT